MKRGLCAALLLALAGCATPSDMIEPSISLANVIL